jgi:hypothetical protein
MATADSLERMARKKASTANATASTQKRVADFRARADEFAAQRQRDALYQQGGFQGFEAGLGSTMAAFGKSDVGKFLGDAYSGTGAGNLAFRAGLAGLSVPSEVVGGYAKNIVDFAAKPNLTSLVNTSLPLLLYNAQKNALSGVADPSQAQPTLFEQAGQSVIDNKMFGAGNAENDALARIVGGTLNIAGDPTTYIGAGIAKSGIKAGVRAGTRAAAVPAKPAGVPKTELSIGKGSSSIYETDRTIEAYGVGKGKKPVVFQGPEEDFSNVASAVKIVPPTPEGILREAINNKTFPGVQKARLQSLLRNFQNNKIGKQETQFLDNMWASVGEEGGTEGLALLVKSLTGDKGARTVINNRTKAMIQAVKNNRANNVSRTINEDYGTIEPKNTAAIHSTQYPIEFDKNGNVVFRAGGDYGGDYARSTLHFSLEEGVKDVALFGEWNPLNQKVVSSFDSVVKKNGLPDTANAQDTYFARSPGQELKVPNAAIVTPMQNAAQYQAELLKRGLIKPGDEVPPLVVDKAQKEILHMSSGVKGETAEIDRAAIAAAKDLLGMEPQRLVNDGLDFAVKNWAAKNKVRSGPHSQSSTEILEKIDGIGPVGNFIDSLEALRHAARRGKFQNYIDVKYNDVL